MKGIDTVKKKLLVILVVLIILFICTSVKAAEPETATQTETVEISTVAETQADTDPQEITYQNADVMVFFAVSILCGITTSCAVMRRW